MPRWLPTLISLALSLLLHLSVLGPWLVFAWDELDVLDDIGEDGPDDASMGDGDLGQGGAEQLPLETPSVPVEISMYVPPPPARSSTPAPKSTETVNEQPTGTTQQEGTDQGEATPVSSGSPDNSGVKGKPPRGKRKPCDPVEEITKLGERKWRVERSLIDYYAHHLKELDRQAATKTMRGEDGKAIGVRVYVPRCSILRKVGFRNGDIIHSVNGRKVATVPQAVASWLALRKKKDFEVELTRKDGREVTFRYRVIK